MRHLNTRPAIALLTFTLGVMLVLASAYLTIRPGGPPPPPCNPVEATPAPAPAEQTPAKDETQSEPFPDWLVKVGELPEHDAGETQGFSIAFVSQSVGWLANGAKLWRTTDGGAHWELVYSKGKASWLDPEAIDEFKFINPADGWMLANNHLYRTHDGGRTLGMPKVDGYFTTLDFLPGGKVGWMGGSVCGPLWKDESAANRFYCSAPENIASFAAVFVTRDGGRTWRRQPVSRLTGTIGHLRMRSERSGFAIGQAGAFRYEGGRWLDAESQMPHDDEGQSMYGERCLDIVIGMPTYCPVSFHFTDDKHGWLSNSDGYLCRTGDGGRTWVDISRGAEEGQPVDAPVPPFFTDFYIGADGSGMALDTDGDLQLTGNGGVTWARATEREAFVGMFALDAERVWLIGADGVYGLNNVKAGP
jgi:photosystem II stability/assembly factor-like uncharacterized protein